VKRAGFIGIFAAILPVLPVPAQTNTIPATRLLKRTFSDYTVLFLVPAEEPWRASWNDRAQMSIFENPTNHVVITTQYLKFPLDGALREAAGNRDAFMDVALRQYCAVQLERSGDSLIRSQFIKLQSRQLGEHYFRYCPIIGRDARGGRRGFFYVMLRGAADKPQFAGDTLIFTIGFPDLIEPEDERRALKVFDVMLQNASFF
jgi:hypothetical protein